MSFIKLIVMKTSLVIIHYGELALKKKNRGFFEDRLISNIRAKLRDMPLRDVRKLAGRFLIGFKEDVLWESVASRLRYVFGLTSASPVCQTSASIEDLESKIVSAASNINFETFAVRSKRAFKNFPLTSPEIEKRIGAEIQKVSGSKVDLKNPERIFNIEVLNNEIFFSYEKIKGSGGLPIGISGHALGLLSGGIDSPVACWKMMKRGLKLSFIHFHSKPFTDDASVEKVEDMADELNQWQGGSRLALVPFGELQKKIVTSVPSKYRVLMYRRFMMRIANRVAEEIEAMALVTGEALGQVASQTLSNMTSVESISNISILRPLIGMDKQEIVDLAKDIGTFEMSIKPHQDCCSFLQPPNPATKSRSEELDRVERALEVDFLVEEAIKGIEWKS